jgi:hypothetical protein
MLCWKSLGVVLCSVVLLNAELSGTLYSLGGRAMLFGKVLELLWSVVAFCDRRLLSYFLVLLFIANPLLLVA